MTRTGLCLFRASREFWRQLSFSCWWKAVSAHGELDAHILSGDRVVGYRSSVRLRKWRSSRLGKRRRQLFPGSGCRFQIGIAATHTGCAMLTSTVICPVDSIPARGDRTSGPAGPDAGQSPSCLCRKRRSVAGQNVCLRQCHIMRKARCLQRWIAVVEFIFASGPSHRLQVRLQRVCQVSGDRFPRTAARRAAVQSSFGLLWEISLRRHGLFLTAQAQRCSAAYCRSVAHGFGASGMSCGRGSAACRWIYYEQRPAEKI